MCLNPYCNGQWSYTKSGENDIYRVSSLNPYCNGQWSHTYIGGTRVPSNRGVLILIVMDNGLIHI